MLLGFNSIFQFLGPTWSAVLIFGFTAFLLYLRVRHGFVLSDEWAGKGPQATESSSSSSSDNNAGGDADAGE